MVPSTNSAQILVVDDQEPNVELLASLLRRAGYRAVTTLTDPREVVAHCIRLQPDLLILDLMMPYLDGFGVMEQLRPWMAGQGYFPILVLTADITLAAKQRALTLGARDFVAKPFDTTEIL